MSFKKFSARVLFFLILFPGSLGLRDVAIIIPEIAERGKPVTIRCLYDLENEDLYQVKWYRGPKEFCRYVPTEVPRLKIFPIPGINVDLKGTGEKQLTISSATSAAQGSYTCEVSADAPSFLTVRLQGFMYVVGSLRTCEAQSEWEYEQQPVDCLQCPTICSPETSYCRIQNKGASWNQMRLWAVCSIALMAFGEHCVG